MDSFVVRFRGSEANDSLPVAIKTESIIHIRKVDDDYCQVTLNSGEKIYIREQLNVAQARWELALSAIEAIRTTPLKKAKEGE
jgi:hypothetical protein